jgi:hypothetical protein
MATAKDYLLDDDLDLVISNGDFKKGPSDQQASILLMNTNIGSWKFFPFAGMGIKKYQGSSGTEQIMKRELMVQHEADGLKIKQLFVKDFQFWIDFSRPGYDD